MRIGVDGRGIYPQMEGIGRYSLGLIRGLAAIDRANEYVLFKNHSCRQPLVDAPNFSEVGLPYPHLTARTCLALPLPIHRARIDLFHSLFFVAPLWGVKNLVVTVHDVMALTFPGFFSGRSWIGEKGALAFHRLLVPLSLRRAKRIIAVSSVTKQEIVRLLKIPPERIAVVPEAADPAFRPIEERTRLEQFRRRSHLPEEFILYVGNTRPYKNIPRLLEAYAHFHRRGGNVKLVISGKKDRFHPLVRRKIEELSLEQEVLLFNDVPEQDLPLLYNCAKIFVFPSLAEGFGLPVLEAMSCGVPVIASTIPPLVELLDETGLAVDPLDAGALADAMASLLRNGSLRESLKERGIRRAREFSWKETARKTLEEYEGVLDGCPRHQAFEGRM